MSSSRHSKNMVTVINTLIVETTTHHRPHQIIDQRET